MTWPFENDTSGIVKKISESSIRSSKTRNIFTVVTIALASALLATVFLWTFGTHAERINMVKETAQIVYRGLSEQQGNQLYDQEEIEWVGEILNGPAERINNATVNFSYGNAEMLASQQMEFKGEIPQKENEIMLSKSFLDILGCEDKLGQKISFSFEDGSTHEFVLSGIWSSVYEVKGTYLALVSKAYLDKMAGSVLPMDYFIGLKNATTMSEEEANKYALTLAGKLNISDDQTVVRSDYFMQLEDTSMGDEMGFFIVVGLLTLLGAGIVIYSIFYISVAGNIRSYGQLRTIGTTKAQIKRIVYREGKLLAAVGIPLGLLIGNIIGYVLLPGGWNLRTTVLVTVGTGIFALLIVIIAIHTPVKKAANISPIEAVRYSPYQGKKKESAKLHRKITPFSLARMNLSRNKLKSILTILSLSIGGVLLVTLSTVLISHDSYAEARGNSFPVGEFKINLNANQSWETAEVSLAGLQRQNLLNDEFVAQLENINGVKGVKRLYYTDAEYHVNGSSNDWIQGFCRDEQKNLEDNLIAGTVDYDELIAGNGIVMMEERLKNVYEMEAALGDTVKVDYENAAGELVTKSYTIMGVISDYNYVGFKKCFTLPEQLINEATGMDCTGTISVITDQEQYQAVEAGLRQLLSGNSNFTLETIEEKINSLESMYQFVYGVLLIIAVVITCFSLINLVNTTITNFISRKQEFGILQSIGLTEKQLLKMLQYEGLIYSASATIITVILGAGMGYLAVCAMKTTNAYFFFNFPWAVVIGYLVAILIVQVILSAFTTRTLKKQSLVDRIKAME